MNKTVQVVYANHQAYMRSIIEMSFIHLGLDEDKISPTMLDALAAVAANALQVDMDERGLEIVPKPKWNVFDKDDKNTWPEDGTQCWIIDARHPRQSRMKLRFRPENAGWWGNVSCWMPMEAPEPPQ